MPANLTFQSARPGNHSAGNSVASNRVISGGHDVKTHQYERNVPQQNVNPPSGRPEVGGSESCNSLPKQRDVESPVNRPGKSFLPAWGVRPDWMPLDPSEADAHRHERAEQHTRVIVHRVQNEVRVGRPQKRIMRPYNRLRGVPLLDDQQDDNPVQRNLQSGISYGVPVAFGG